MSTGPTQASGMEAPSTAMDNEPDTSPGEVSSHFPRVPEVVPSGWADRLLVASCDLPIEAGAHSVIEAMVDALASILPAYAVGACYVPEPSDGPREQVVIKRVPDRIVEAPAGLDPTRIFAFMACEHVAPIAGSTTGSTLHVAADHDDLDRAASPAVHLVERATVARGRALDLARQIEALRDARRDVRTFEDRLIQADKLATFGQIAAGVVHELNNPLTSIVAYSDYLIRKAVAVDGAGRATDEEDLERLRRISASANRMLRFTRDLMGYARPSAGVRGPVVVHGVIDQAIAFCEHILAGAGMRVERRYGHDVLMVRGVSEQLVQVFVNLLTNASQAARPEGGGCIAVTTSVDTKTRRVRVEVRDDGPGIAPEHLSQVFTPFFTTKGDRQGTGLGLSIVRSIVVAHDGDIRATSDAGSGAAFVLELPVYK